MARRLPSTGSWLRWLTPGLQIKRWLLLLMVSELVLVLGVAYALKEIYQTAHLPSSFFYITLQFLPYWARAIIFGIFGVGLLVVSYLKLTQSVLGPFLPGNSTSSIVEVIHAFRLRGRGPRVVAIGGGTGLSSLLRGLKTYTSNLSAIVTVADDGGSSGRLRRVSNPSARRLPPVPDRARGRRAVDEAALRPSLQRRLAQRARLREPFHHGDGRRHRKLRTGPSRIGQGARGQGHDRAVDAAGRDVGGVDQRQHRRGRVADPQAELADQPCLPEARRRAGQPRSRAGYPERRADHRRPGLPVHLDPSQSPGRGYGRSDQGLRRSQALYLQPRRSAGRDGRLRRAGLPASDPRACGRQPLRFRARQLEHDPRTDRRSGGGDLPARGHHAASRGSVHRVGRREHAQAITPRFGQVGADHHAEGLAGLDALRRARQRTNASTRIVATAT